MSAHRTGLLLAVCVGVNLALGQNASAAPDTNPIGKVLTTTGTVGSVKFSTLIEKK